MTGTTADSNTRCHQEFQSTTIWRCELEEGHDGLCVIARKQKPLSSNTIDYGEVTERVTMEALPKGAHECHCEICPEYCMGDCVCGGACYCKEERKE
jgi:hypothetical protein